MEDGEVRRENTLSKTPHLRGWEWQNRCLTSPPFNCSVSSGIGVPSYRNDVDPDKLQNQKSGIGVPSYRKSVDPDKL